MTSTGKCMGFCPQTHVSDYLGNSLPIIAHGDPWTGSFGTAAMNQEHYNQIVQLFRRSGALPHLPEPAMRLIEMIDRGDPSAAELEAVIAGDASLAASLLRTASSSFYGATQPVTTVRGAVLRLGLRAVRTIALTFAMQAFLRRTTETEFFDPVRFARHSLYVAVLSRTLYQRVGPAERRLAGWTVEEIFAASLLHDLPSCLLAQLAPDLFDRAWLSAHENGTTLEDGFEATFGVPLPLLGCAAVSAWRLPSLFAQGIAFIAEPPENQYLDVCRECVLCADQIAAERGFGREEWELPRHYFRTEFALPVAELEAMDAECDDLMDLAHKAA